MFTRCTFISNCYLRYKASSHEHVGAQQFQPPNPTQPQNSYFTFLFFSEFHAPSFLERIYSSAKTRKEKEKKRKIFIWNSLINVSTWQIVTHSSNCILYIACLFSCKAFQSLAKAYLARYMRSKTYKSQELFRQ